MMCISTFHEVEGGTIWSFIYVGVIGGLGGIEGVEWEGGCGEGGVVGDFGGDEMSGEFILSGVCLDVLLHLW